jgi:hypothetical protein
LKLFGFFSVVQTAHSLRPDSSGFETIWILSVVKAARSLRPDSSGFETIEIPLQSQIRRR